MTKKDLERNLKKLASAKWRKANPERSRAAVRRANTKWRKDNPKTSTKYWLMRREQKAGRPCPKYCEVCERPGRICADHCHVTNLFRGWLCAKCNSTLGFAEDRPKILVKLAKFLRAAHKRNGIIEEKQ